jgi:hypothetical protein
VALASLSPPVIDSSPIGGPASQALLNHDFRTASVSESGAAPEQEDRTARASSLPFQYLVLDIRTQTVTRHWLKGAAVPFGSLLKPFLTLAFARTHAAFPTIECKGAASRCWWPKGHGRMTIVPALAHSCNAYFLALAAQVDSAALKDVCSEYQLASPAAHVTPDELIGLRSGWPQQPEAVLNAFARLVSNRSEGSVGTVLEGMRLCATSGTAAGLHLQAYAKTGTAPCSHKPQEEGDGYVAVAYPNDVPRLILLAQQHNTTGAHTAIMAGDLLRREYGAVRAR